MHQSKKKLPLSLRKLCGEDVRRVISWRYEMPYDFYNTDQAISVDTYCEMMLDPTLNFHAVCDASGLLVGFCSFGADGQVEGGDYSAPAIDIGLGMRPELTGNGLGKVFMSAILAHATELFGPVMIRLTVANFNRRAMALYTRMEFKKTARFSDQETGTGFTVLTLKPGQ